MASSTLLKTPNRSLFIASIGNPKPYEQSRHSAGHILLDAIKPLLLPRFPFVSTQFPQEPVFYRTWRSNAVMNVSGTKTVKQLREWLAVQNNLFQTCIRRGDMTLLHLYDTGSGKKPEWDIRGVDPISLTQIHPTLVILHDELEAPLGKVKVRHGGPEKASLRGHRGLISIMESLRGAGLHPQRGDQDGRLSIMRVGVGIGRPSSRDKGSVADYVLTKMNDNEMKAVHAAARPVVDILADEFYRIKDIN